MSEKRVYPVRVQARDLALHRLSLATLTAVNDTWPGSRSVEETMAALHYRIACAERWEEIKEKRLTDEERAASVNVLSHVAKTWAHSGDAAGARALSRVLVRLTRDQRPPARPRA